MALKIIVFFPLCSLFASVIRSSETSNSRDTATPRERVRNKYRPSKKKHVLLCSNAFLFTFARFCWAPAGFVSRFGLCGTQGGHLYTPAQVWVRGGLSAACSWRSRSRNQAFRGTRAEQDNGKPTCQLFSSTPVKAQYFVAETVQQQSHDKFVSTTTPYACVLCVL